MQGSEEPGDEAASADAAQSAGWFSAAPVAPGITRLTEPFVHPYLSANIFHVRGRDRDLVVDTGMGLAPLTSALPLTSGKPKVAIATHIHLDHVGGLHEFAERWGPAQSAAGFADMPDALTYESAFGALDQPVTRAPAPGWKARDYALRPAPLTRTLDEGDCVDLGDRLFRVLALPGHSPDSIGLFEEASGVFFAGDAIYDSDLIDDLPDSDRAAYRATMRRLLGLNPSLVLGGHGEPFGGARMRRIALDYLTRTGG